LFLKDKHSVQEDGSITKKRSFKQKFFDGFNSSFSAVTNRYIGGIKFLIRRKWIAMGGLALVTLVTVYLVSTTKSGFIPTEDQGFVAIAVSTPSGTSLTGTTKILNQAEEKLRALPASRFVTSISGFNLLTSSNSPSAAVVFVLLKPNEDRGEVKDIEAIQNTIRGQLAELAGGTFFVFSFPTVPGFSNVEALDLVLQDKSGGKLDKFSGVANNFIGKLMQKKGNSLRLLPSFKADYPQLQLEVNDEKAAQLGVNVKTFYKPCRHILVARRHQTLIALVNTIVWLCRLISPTEMILHLLTVCL
jgi:HAE1 family hydrophobic/amphiphilic exporter-1